MKVFITTLAAVTAMTGAAFAQSSSTGSSANSSVQLSASECTNLWQQAHGAGGGAGGLTQMQAKNYVTDFKAANPDGDATIDQNEWMTACNKGLVKSSSASGASSGTSGAGSPATKPSGSSSGTR